MKKKIAAVVLFMLASLLVSIAVSAESDSNFTNLTVFVKFADEAEFVDNIYDNATVKEILDNTYNKSEYSVADYFSTVSGGKMRMKTLYLFDEGGSVTLSRERGYYAEKDDENPNGYEVGEEGLRLYDLREDFSRAITQAFERGNAPVDSDGNRCKLAELDKNSDGKIDLLTIIYKNTEQNISVGWSSPLWDCQFYSDMVSVSDGERSIISGECLQLTGNYENKNGSILYRGDDNLPIMSTGKICHETMHALGLKDLYRSNQTSKVYYMSLMGKHLSPIGQYISVKERESLSWLEDTQMKTIWENGKYTLSEASSSEGTVGYKRELPNGKTLYLEYRRFDDGGNKYDKKSKRLYSCKNGDAVKGVTLKSGMVCYLANTGVRFPSNLSTAGSNWNMEVVSAGQYSTMSDCAAEAGDTIYVGGVTVSVTRMTEDELEFEISGVEYVPPQLECEMTGDRLSVRPKNLDNGGRVLVAEYDENGVFVRISEKAISETLEFSVKPETKKAKVMLWESVEKMIPLIASETINR